MAKFAQNTDLLSAASVTRAVRNSFSVFFFFFFFVFEFLSFVSLSRDQTDRGTMCLLCGQMYDENGADYLTEHCCGNRYFAMPSCND